MNFKQIFKYFVVWQIMVTLVVAFSSTLLPLRLSDSYLGGGITFYLKNPLLNFRSNFDGVHYVLIATHGYNFGQQAFFPLYPALIRTFRPVFVNPILTGVVISSVAFLGILLLLYRLVRLDYSESTARWTIIALLIFPTSFFFTTVYTESLFVFLVLTSFYLARTRRWWLACLVGGLASYTRLIGIFLFPALLVELWSQLQTQRFTLKKFAFSSLPLLLIPAGLVYYMSYLDRTTGDPLAFYHVQSLFNQSRSLNIVLPYQVFWRYFRMVLTVSRTDPLYLTICLELAVGIAFNILSLFSLFRQRLSYAIFSFCAFIIPTFTGNFVSLPRYVLVCFPAFIVLGRFLEVNSKYRIVIIPVFVFTWIIFLSLFARGYWVS